MIMEVVDHASATLGEIDTKFATLGTTTAATATRVEQSGASIEKAAGGMGGALSLAGFGAEKAWLAALGPIAIVAGAIGLLAGMAKNAEANARAHNDMGKALQNAGLDATTYSAKTDEFIRKNQRWIANNNDVREGLAELIRQGHSYGEAMDIINISIDFATASHKGLKDAIHDVGLATQGRGRALLDLGIKMKDYPALMEGEVQADARIQAAKKAVEKAQENLTRAQDAYTRDVHGKHAPAANSLHTVTVTLDEVMNRHVGTHGRLQTAHTASTKGADDHSAASRRLHDAQNKLDEAHRNLAKAEDWKNEKQRESTKLLADLHGKTKNFRDAQTEAEQATHNLGGAWERISNVVGPPLLDFFSKVIESLAWIVDHVAAVLEFFDKMSHNKDNLYNAEKARQQTGGLLGLGNIKVFGAGGIVTGPTLALIGESGPEAVVPLGMGAGVMGGMGGGTVIHNTFDLRNSTITDERGIRELADKISKLWTQSVLPSSGTYVRR